MKAAHLNAVSKQLSNPFATKADLGGDGVQEDLQLLTEGQVRPRRRGSVSWFDVTIPREYWPTQIAAVHCHISFSVWRVSLKKATQLESIGYSVGLCGAPSQLTVALRRQDQTSRSQFFVGIGDIGGMSLLPTGSLNQATPKTALVPWHAWPVVGEDPRGAHLTLVLPSSSLSVGPELVFTLRCPG